MSGAGFALVALAVLVASCLQASIGFGMGMLAAPVVAIVDATLLPAMLIMLAMVVTLTVTASERQHIDLRGTGWALAGRVPGTVLGATLVAVLPARGLALLIAGVVLLGVVLASLGWAPHPRRRNLVLAGATSGVFGTATSIGGPPMALVWQRSTGARLRGTMGGFFLVGSLLSVASLMVAGAISTRTVALSGLLIPPVLAGYVLSRWVNTLLNPARLRRVALAMSTFGAVVLVGQQVLAVTG